MKQIEMDISPAAPQRPALRYFGGKWRLAKWVASHFPEHKTYVEPFGGGASVLLRKQPSPVEVYNDTAGEVVNFFRVLRDEGESLISQLETTPFAFEEYSACRSIEGSDVERARRFYVRSWGGFGGCRGVAPGSKMRSTGWRRSPTRDTAGQFVSAVDSLSVIKDRLRGVIIESMDWRKVLSTWGGERTLFYIDPPYVLSERGRTCPSDGYGEGFEMTDDEHAELCTAILKSPSSAVLSGYRNRVYDEMLSGLESFDANSATQTTSRVETVWVKR